MHRNRDVRQGIALISALVCAALLIFYLSGIHRANGYFYDADGYVIGIDFLNTWMMGHAGWVNAQPEKYYDIETYTQAIRTIHGEAYRYNQWSYPPSFMLFGVVFAWLPYGLALLVFTLGGIWLMTVAIRAITGPDWARDVMAVATSPAALFATISGQVSCFAAAAQLWFFHLLDRRPVLAGILLGLLSIKPQLGLLYPFFLIATKRWKVFVSAACTVAVLIALSLSIWGLKLWDAYFTLGVPMQQEYVLKHTPKSVAAMMPTFYIDLKLAGVPHAAALLGQGLLAVSVIGALFTRRFARMDAATQRLVVALGGLLVSPYFMAYDLVFVAAALMLWLRTCVLTRVGSWWVAGCFWLPFIHLVAVGISVPGTALIPAGLLVWIFQQAKWRT